MQNFNLCLNFFFFFFNNLVKYTFLLNLESTFYTVSFFSFTLYILAVSGLIFNIKNLLISLFFIEIAYFAIIIFFLLTAFTFQNFEGALYALILILIAASESAVGLGLVILLFSFEKKITFNHLNELA